MAEIHLPIAEHIAPRSRVDPLIPFITCSNGDYLDGHNDYLQERCAGRINPANIWEQVIQPKSLSFNTSLQIAHHLCDFRTFCETESAHPSLGVIATESVKGWHILDTYAGAMNRGIWTNVYYEKGVIQPLHPTGTVNPRVKENVRLFLWLAARGYISSFSQSTDFSEVFSESEITNKRVYSTLSLSDAPPKQNVKGSPGGGLLPSPQHMVDFLNSVSKGASRIAAIGIHEHGFRRSELCHGVLLPGYNHVREPQKLRKLNLWHSGWTDEPTYLQHDLYDDRMIGVLPDRDWGSELPGPKFKIIGKGNVVRLIHIKPQWLARVVKYCDSDRRNSVSVKPIDQRPANLLIDRTGKPLSPEALYQAMRRANQKLKTSLKITPHTLRHIFACRFLQVALEADAKRQGVEVDALTRTDINRNLELPLEALRLELGHADLETTRIYVELLIKHWIAPRYHSAWNSILDKVE